MTSDATVLPAAGLNWFHLRVPGVVGVERTVAFDQTGAVIAERSRPAEPSLPIRPTAAPVADGPTAFVQQWGDLPGCGTSDLEQWATGALGVRATLRDVEPAELVQTMSLLRQFIPPEACATLQTDGRVGAWELRAADGAIISRAAIRNGAPDGGISRTCSPTPTTIR